MPQILTNVNHDMNFMTAETFGPCVGIMKVKDENEAINLMNDRDNNICGVYHCVL